MRYESIQLNNYIGILYGMKLDSITLDFRLCKNNKVLIIGPNGSGKSTIISSINPYPESNEYFVTGKEASKIITLIDGDAKYIIKYIHPVNGSGDRLTTKGYITKFSPDNNYNGIELNPSGNISSCKDIIYNEFELEPGFSSLSQLSSEDRGLVERKPAERKKLVSYIISSLDVYNNIYKTINKKYSIIKSLIQSITSKIDNIGNKEKLLALLENIMKHITELENDKQKTLEAIALLKIKINDEQQILDSNNYEDVSHEYQEIDSTISFIDKSIKELLTKYNMNSIDDLKLYYSKLCEQIVIISSDIQHLKTDIPLLINDYNHEIEKLQAKQQEYNSLNSKFDQDLTIETLESYKRKMGEYEEIFNAMRLQNISLITKDEFNTAMINLKKLQVESENITTQYSLSDIRLCIEESSKVIDIINNIHSIEQELANFRSKSIELSNQLSIYSTKRELASKLNDRPKGCNINSCIFISAFIEAENQYPESGYIALQEQYKQLQEYISSLEKELEYAKHLNLVYNSVTHINHLLDDYYPFIKKLPVRVDFKETFFHRILDLDPFNDIDELYKYVDLGNALQEYQSLQRTVLSYESRLQLYLSNNTMLESLSKDIEELNSKTNKLNLNIQENRTKYNELINKLNNLVQSKSSIEKVINDNDTILVPSIRRRQELQTIIDSLKNSITCLEEYKKSLSILESNLVDINNDLNALNNEKQSIKHNLLMLDEYQIELDKYNKEYKLIEKVKYYSSPSTGIQNIYLSMFMNKILNTANQLLSLLFNGRFMFGSFIINDTEFRIPAIGESGIMHNDISEMSSAEKSMLSLVISFSLLNASSTKYNIISLDESDGPLDTDNRSAFVNLLDQIMHILYVEQAFIISHNPEIDISSCDIINLHRQPVNNGNVIWQL